MRSGLTAGTTIFLAAALAACDPMIAGGAAGGIDVSRTHLGQPIARAQIAIEPANLADANSAEFRASSAAVQRELTRNGYNVEPLSRTSEQVARIDVRQGSHSALTTGWPGVQARGGEGTNAMLLDVRIQCRSDGTVFWQGRAVGDWPDGADRTATVERLATALFRDFPGESGRTIRVR